MYSDNLMRPADKNLLINKLQATLEEIARGVDDSALAAIGTNTDDNRYDVTEGDINNVILPAEEKKMEVLEQKVEVIENKIQIEAPQENIINVEEVVEKAKINENKADDDDMSSEAIRYNSKGESIENPKAQAIKSVA